MSFAKVPESRWMTMPGKYRVEMYLRWRCGNGQAWFERQSEIAEAVGMTAKKVSQHVVALAREGVLAAFPTLRGDGKNGFSIYVVIDGVAIDARAVAEAKAAQFGLRLASPETGDASASPETGDASAWHHPQRVTRYPEANTQKQKHPEAPFIVPTGLSTRVSTLLDDEVTERLEDRVNSTASNRGHDDIRDRVAWHSAVARYARVALEAGGDEFVVWLNSQRDDDARHIIGEALQIGDRALDEPEVVGDLIRTVASHNGFGTRAPGSVGAALAGVTPGWEATR
jgi:hypothetical protein